MKGSDLLVSSLENEGVEWIFDVPGEENLDIVEIPTPLPQQAGPVAS